MRIQIKQMCGTYMLFRYRGSGQADSNNGEAGKSKKYEGKVQVVDISQDGRPVIRLATGRRTIGELENHTNYSHCCSNHQPPKCTLRNRNIKYWLEMLLL